MKNQYFGDQNDYVKYGLLRCLSDAGWNVGVCWMLTPDDGRSDGSRRSYLSNPKRWRHHDPQLFDFLKSANERGVRDVSSIEKSGLIHASFFTQLTPDARPLRSAWFTNAQSALASANLLLFDPDNGIEIDSKSMGRKDSSKFLSWDEIRSVWADGSSLLAYQHFPQYFRHREYTSREEYVRYLSHRVAQIAVGGTVTALVSPYVLFLLVVHTGARLKLESALDAVRAK